MTKISATYSGGSIMGKYVILADITCDLSQQMRDFCGMEYYIDGHLHISANGAEKDLVTKLDWSQISYEELYGTLADKKAKVTTSPPNVEEYTDVFEKYAKEGYDILSMSLSAKISGTFDFACAAAKRVKEKYPDVNIYCFNSMRMSGAFALLTMYAFLMKKDGKSFDEVISWLEANKQRVHQMGPVDDLVAVARRGRITMGKAIMGSFANVKPMGDCNSEGYVTVLTKAKGIRKALELTVSYVKETAVDAQNNYAVIYHTDREQYALTLKEMIEKELGFKKVFVSCCFSGNAVNIGPGMIGIYYFGNEITDLATEKDIITKLNSK